MNSGCYKRIPQTNWLGQQVISHSFEAEESNIKVLVDLLSDEEPLPDVQIAVFLLCPNMVMRKKKARGWQKENEREIDLWCLRRALIA